MSKLLPILICLLLVGCISISDEEVILDTMTEVPKGTTRRFISLRQIRKGMTRKEVASILSDKVVVGYELIEPISGQYKPIVVNNPYRSEAVKRGSASYHVDYYLEKIKIQDSIVSDEELMPLVFRDDKLVGEGWDFLKKKIKN